MCVCLLRKVNVLLTAALLLTGRGGARVGLCGCRGFTEAPEGGLSIHKEIKRYVSNI
jgi:hypothetical protein